MPAARAAAPRASAGRRPQHPAPQGVRSAGRRRPLARHRSATGRRPGQRSLARWHAGRRPAGPACPAAGESGRAWFRLVGVPRGHVAALVRTQRLPRWAAASEPARTSGCRSAGADCRLRRQEVQTRRMAAACPATPCTRSCSSTCGQERGRGAGLGYSAAGGCRAPGHLISSNWCRAFCPRAAGAAAPELEAWGSGSGPQPLPPLLSPATAARRAAPPIATLPPSPLGRPAPARLFGVAQGPKRGAGKARRSLFKASNNGASRCRSRGSVTPLPPLPLLRGEQPIVASASPA